MHSPYGFSQSPYVRRTTMVTKSMKSSQPFKLNVLASSVSVAPFYRAADATVDAWMTASGPHRHSLRGSTQTDSTRTLRPQRRTTAPIDVRS